MILGGLVSSLLVSSHFMRMEKSLFSQAPPLQGGFPRRMAWGGSRTDPKGGQICGPWQRWTTLTSMSLRPPHPLYSFERSPLILCRTPGHSDDCDGGGSRTTDKMATGRYVARSVIRSLTPKLDRPVGRSVARSPGRGGGRVVGRSLGRYLNRSGDRSLRL